jgi:hypothetical protein
MKKYLLPILLAGAGAVVFFTLKGKKDKETETDNEESTSTSKPKGKPKGKPKNPKKKPLKGLNINNVIDKISKGKTLINKIKGKIKGKRKPKKGKSTLPPSPLQPKAKEPVKFY